MQLALKTAHELSHPRKSTDTGSVPKDASDMSDGASSDNVVACCLSAVQNTCMCITTLDESGSRMYRDDREDGTPIEVPTLKH